MASACLGGLAGLGWRVRFIVGRDTVNSSASRGMGCPFGVPCWADAPPAPESVPEGVLLVVAVLVGRQASV